MKFRKTGLKWILCVSAVAALVVVIRYSSSPVVELGGHRRDLEALYALQMRMINDFDWLSDEEKVFQLVEGDVLSLEQWLVRKYDERIVIGGNEHLFTSWLGWAQLLVKRDPSGEIRLVDDWGQRLVYRCPHPNSAYICQLYSIGPNGIDEGGQGDDIEDAVPYTSISGRFEDPDFNGDVYRKFRGRLTNVTINGRSVIRHP